MKNAVLGVGFCAEFSFGILWSEHLRTQRDQVPVAAVHLSPHTYFYYISLDRQHFMLDFLLRDEMVSAFFFCKIQEAVRIGE